MKIKVPPLKEMKMDRPTLINELRRYMRPEQYRKIFSWKTEHIASLYKFYKTT